MPPRTEDVSLKESPAAPKASEGLSKEESMSKISSDISGSSCPSKSGWWRCGGMHINLNGMGINIYGSLYFLLANLPMAQIKAYAALLLGCVTFSLLCGMRTMYCILIVPTFMTSMILCLTLDVNNIVDTSLIADIPLVKYLAHPAVLLVPSVMLAMAKVNICMSVCLHRYAAHNAFKCGPITSFFINALGCCSIQGGPIWWASQHRQHHKFCDVLEDPHSPVIMGVEKAFAFFEIHPNVREEFVPRHLEGPFNRILDTWSFLVVMLELAIVHHFFGLEGLFISFTSGWMCQSITLWFNIVNHPTDEMKFNKNGQEIVCKATDGAITPPDSWYLPWHILHRLIPIFASVIMEAEHKHHHDHSTLAKRSWYDPAYWFFVKPLELAGLVWDVNVGEF